MTIKNINLNKLQLYSFYVVFLIPLFGLASLGRYGAYISFEKIHLPIFFALYMCIVLYGLFSNWTLIIMYFKATQYLTLFIFLVVLGLLIRLLITMDVSVSIRDILYDLSLFFIIFSIPIISCTIDTYLKKIIINGFILSTILYGVTLISEIHNPINWISNPLNIEFMDPTVYFRSAEVFSMLVSLSLLLIANSRYENRRYLYCTYLICGIYVTMVAGSRLGVILLCSSSFMTILSYRNIKIKTFFLVVIISILISTYFNPLKLDNANNYRSQSISSSTGEAYSNKIKELSPKVIERKSVIDKLTFNMSEGSLAARFQTWNLIYIYYLDNPVKFLIGDGFGSNILVTICNNYAGIYDYKFRVESLGRYVCPAEDTNYKNPLRDPHNFFINQLLYSGFVGVLVIIFLCYKYFQSFAIEKFRANFYFILFISSLSSTLLSSPVTLIPIAYVFAVSMNVRVSLLSK